MISPVAIQILSERAEVNTKQLRTMLTDGRFFDIRHGKPIGQIHADLDGSSVYIYLKHFVELFDVVILKRNKNIFTKDQDRLITKYFNEADSGIVSPEIQVLDQYLANYQTETIPTLP